MKKTNKQTIEDQKKNKNKAECMILILKLHVTP